MAKSRIEKEVERIEKTFDEVSIASPKHYPEDLQLALVRSRPENIYWIADPCVRAQVEAATADRNTLQPYVLDAFIYDSPVTDVGALKEILTADPGAVGYMDRQIKMHKGDEDFDRAVREACDNVSLSIAEREGFLMETDNKLFIRSDDGRIPKVGGGITAADIADMQAMRGDEYEEVVVVYPSEEHGKYDMNVYYVDGDEDPEQTDSYTGYAVKKVLDYMRSDIEEFTMENVEEIEAVRTALNEEKDKGPYKNMTQEETR